MGGTSAKRRARVGGLMVAHEVGVPERVMKVPKVDVDYFEE